MRYPLRNSPYVVYDGVMKVIEVVEVYDRQGNLKETSEVSWGNNITSDFSIITSVAHIVEHQRSRDYGEIQNFPGRFKTIAIRIEL